MPDRLFEFYLRRILGRMVFEADAQPAEARDSLFDESEYMPVALVGVHLVEMNHQSRFDGVGEFIVHR